MSAGKRPTIAPRIPDRRVVGWLSATESAAYLGLHPSTWARYWRQWPDLIASRRMIGKRGRWHVRELDKHVERLPR